VAYSGVPRVLPILTCTLFAGVALAAWRIWPAPSFPTTFDLTFSATGLVENIEFKKASCLVKVAVYDWVNLSQGFELSEIPERSDRYYLRGQGESCQALTVAMAATSQHISFQAGRSGKEWYFTENPSAAVGCGGMKMEWVPDPER
jgi:hypothetical protein